jgi:hypothetical protein
MFLAGSLLSQAQSIPTNETPAPARIYHLLREDADWSFLLGCGVGCGRPTLLDLGGPVACDRNFRAVCSVVLFRSEPTPDKR